MDCDFAAYAEGQEMRLITLAELPDFKDSSPAFRERMRQFREVAATADAVYYHISEPRLWKQLLGSEGYCAVKDGKVIGEIVLRMD